MNSIVNVTLLREDDVIEGSFPSNMSTNKFHNETRIMPYAYPHQAGGRIFVLKEFQVKEYIQSEEAINQYRMRKECHKTQQQAQFF